MKPLFSLVRPTSKLLFLATVIVFSPALGARLNAQVPRSGSPKDKAIEDKYRSDEIERVRREANTPESRQTKRFPQVKEDFERIQLINSDLHKSTATNARLDFKRISNAVGEIKKRATRLRSNLFPAATVDPKQGSQQTEARDDLQALLTELDKAIMIFVHNPMFENTRVVNPQDSTRAESELVKIINLSARAAKKAERKNR